MKVRVYEGNIDSLPIPAEYMEFYQSNRKLIKNHAKELCDDSIDSGIAEEIEKYIGVLLTHRTTSEQHKNNQEEAFQCLACILRAGGPVKVTMEDNVLHIQEIDQKKDNPRKIGGKLYGIMFYIFCNDLTGMYNLRGLETNMQIAVQNEEISLSARKRMAIEDEAAKVRDRGGGSWASRVGGSDMMVDLYGHVASVLGQDGADSMYIGNGGF